MLDGMSSGEFKATDLTLTGSLISALISGNVAALGASEIGNAELAASAASGTKVDATFGVVGTGSPVAFGKMVQASNGTTSAGSILWVPFGRAFAAAPFVVCTAVGATANGTSVVGSPIAVGSFLAVSEAASQLFNWIAVGSGR